MSLKAKVDQDLKAAMKARDKATLSVLRMVRSQIQQAEIAARGKQGPDYELTDPEVLEVLGRYGKQRRESVDSYREAGREDLAAKEESELAIVQRYLPEQLSEARIREIVARAVADAGATSMKDIGAVMQRVMPEVKGRADGKLVQRIVRESIGG